MYVYDTWRGQEHQMAKALIIYGAIFPQQGIAVISKHETKLRWIPEE